MQTRFRTDAARLAERVRRFLARGRLRRLVACAVVAFAALLWLGIALVVLRVVVIGALVLGAAWCAWLVVSVWRHQPAPDEPAWGPRNVWARIRLLVGERPSIPAADSEPEAALAAFRRSAEALTVELLGRQERLNADAERLQHDLAGQIETMQTLVARIEQLEHRAARPVEPRPSETPVVSRPQAAEAPTEPDVDSLFAELEADLRLEKIDERERELDERERRLDRRQRELAAFVAETQSRLS